MDNVTLIRVVSGILAVVVLFILIYRMKQKPFHLRPGHPQEQTQGSDQKVHVRTPELNRVFTVAGPTLARRPPSGAAFGGIVEARCNQNSTIGPFHFAVCGETILLSPGSNHASNLTEEHAKVYG